MSLLVIWPEVADPKKWLTHSFILLMRQVTAMIFGELSRPRLTREVGYEPNHYSCYAMNE